MLLSNATTAWPPRPAAHLVAAEQRCADRDVASPRLLDKANANATTALRTAAACNTHRPIPGCASVYNDSRKKTDAKNKKKSNVIFRKKKKVKNI